MVNLLLHAFVARFYTGKFTDGFAATFEQSVKQTAGAACGEVMRYAADIKINIQSVITVSRVNSYICVSYSEPPFSYLLFYYRILYPRPKERG